MKDTIQNNNVQTGKLGVRGKIILATAAVAATGITALSTYFVTDLRTTLQEEYQSKLRGVSTIKSSEVETYFRNLRQTLGTSVEDTTLINAATDLSAAKDSLISELEKEGIKVSEDLMKMVRDANRTYIGKNLVEKLKEKGFEGKQNILTPDEYLHKDDVGNLLVYFYIVTNPAQLGSKGDNNSVEDIAKRDVPKDLTALRDAFAKTSFVKKHQEVDEQLQPRAGRLEADLHIVDSKGFVVYTTSKQLDFGGDLEKGADKDQGFGIAHKSAMAATGETAEDRITIQDYAPYSKALGVPSCFMAASIQNGDKKLGSYIIEVPSESLLNFLWQIKPGAEIDPDKTGLPAIGMGRSGENYLVSLNDRGARSNSRFTKNLGPAQKKEYLAENGTDIEESSIFKLKVDTRATQDLISGKVAGFGVYPDYRGINVFGSYQKLEIPGLNYGLISEIDEAEVYEPINKKVYTALGLSAGVLLLGAVGAFAFGNRLARPVLALSDTARKIAEGDNTARAPITSKDEVGELAATFNTMVEARNKAQETIEKENRQLQDGIQHLLMVMSDASDGNMVVRAKVTEGALGNVADAMNLMLENVGDLIKSAKKVSGRVATAAAEINQSATDLADGSVKQSDQLQGASVGAKELSTEAAAVSEACKQATKAAAQSEEAADRGARIVREVIAGMDKIRESVQVNGKKIKRLGERSMEIGGILKTINEISAQTDMLALNASIEAGRAGEAGRGFSAVAEQVRALAERAKLATQQVEKLVGDIQQETAEAVAQTETQTAQVESGAQKVAQAGEALNDIVTVSSQSRDAVTKIASTAEQQAAKTGQMLTAVAGAASIAADSRNKVGGTRLSAEQLTQFAKDLDKQLDQFKVSAN
jgi:methyl-accepting chemotaxis protein